MIAGTVFIPLSYSHNVLWLCYLATFVLSCGAVKKMDRGQVTKPKNLKGKILYQLRIIRL